MSKLTYPNIDAERERNGFSQAELANKLGICRKTYSNWMRRGKIPQKHLEIMSELFGVSIDYFLGRSQRIVKNIHNSK